MDTNKFPTQREIFLAEMECSVPWHRLRALVGPSYSATRRVGPLELDRMLRIYFLQRWFRLTDEAVREAMCDSMSMRSFVCLSAEGVPPAIEIRRFRNLLTDTGLAEQVVQSAERHLRTLGVAVAPGAIVDAALIHASNAHAQAPYSRVIDTAGVAG